MSVCNRNEIYSLQTGFRVYRMLLLGSELYGLKSPQQYTCANENRLFTGHQSFHLIRTTSAVNLRNSQLPQRRSGYFPIKASEHSSGIQPGEETTCPRL